MLFTWERSFDPEMALPRSSSGKSNYLGYIYTHTGQLLRRELKPYRIGLLFTRNYGDLGVISVAEQSWTAPISKVERHVSDLDRYLDGNEKGGASTRTDWDGSDIREWRLGFFFLKFPFSIACEPQTYLSQDGLCEALGEALLAGSPYICPLAKQFAKLWTWLRKSQSSFFRRPSLLYPYPKSRPSKSRVLH